MHHLTPAILSFLLLGGCAAYPLPEDMTGITSDQVANIVRCQMRRAVQDKIIEEVLTSNALNLYQGYSPEELAQRLATDRKYFEGLKWGDFHDKRVRTLFEFYKDTQISYDFTIDVTEMNTTSGGLNLLRQGGVTANTLGFNFQNDRTREVKRHFRVFDSFDSLATHMRESKCVNTLPKDINYIYPITGLIRIQSLVSSFLNMNQNNNLGGQDADYLDAQMGDTITFTTKNTGNFDPTLTRTPLANTFIPSSLTFRSDNNRTDTYTVIVLLSLPAKRSGLPAFDQFGRTVAPTTAARKTSASKEAQKAQNQSAASLGLDQQRAYNAQEALTQIGTSLNRLGQ